MIETLDIQTQLEQRWLVFWWGLALSLLSIGIAWSRGFFKPFKSSDRPFIHGEDVLRGFVLFIVVEALIIPFALGQFFNELTDPIAKGWANLSMVLGGFAVVLFVYSLLNKEQKKDLWSQGNERWTHNLFVGYAAWFISFPFVMAVTQIVSIGIWHLFHQPFIEQTVVISLRLARENPLLFWATAIGIVILVPFTEEFLFRGLLQNWLKRKFGRAWPAVLLTSLIFASFHFTVEQGFSNFELLFSLIILSCILGYIYERQRSLWTPIGLHSLFNFMSLLLIFQE